MLKENKIKLSILVKTIVLSALVLTSCVEFEPVSPIPEISLIDFKITDGYDSLLGNQVKMAELQFNYIDGDADIGVYYDIIIDTNLPDSVRFNFIIEVYDKIDGVYEPKIFWNKLINRLDTLVLLQGILYDQKLDRVGQNKTINGSITSTIQIAQGENLTDTFRLEFYIRDRALNKSNVEVTDDYFIEQ